MKIFYSKENLSYILASCCTVLFNGFYMLCFRLRAPLLCWFSLSFTTCFGLHGHLQVCRIIYFICLKEKKTAKQNPSSIWKQNILHTWRWPCRPKHVVKDSENKHNKAARRRKHNLQNPLKLELSNFVSNKVQHDLCVTEVSRDTCLETTNHIIISCNFDADYFYTTFEK
jgi:hypothetical protein